MLQKVIKYISAILIVIGILCVWWRIVDSMKQDFINRDNAYGVTDMSGEATVVMQPQRGGIVGRYQIRTGEFGWATRDAGVFLCDTQTGQVWFISRE